MWENLGPAKGICPYWLSDEMHKTIQMTEFNADGKLVPTP